MNEETRDAMAAQVRDLAEAVSAVTSALDGISTWELERDLANEDTCTEWGEMEGESNDLDSATGGAKDAVAEVIDALSALDIDNVVSVAEDAESYLQDLLTALDDVEVEEEEKAATG